MFRKALSGVLLSGILLSGHSIAQETQMRVKETFDTRLGIDAGAVVGSDNFTFDGQPQRSTGPDFGSEQVVQEDGSYLVTINENTRNLRGMSVSSQSGVVYSEDQIERTMQLIEINRSDLLGLRISAPERALPSYQSSYYWREHIYDMPDIPFPQPVAIVHQSVTWSGDSDKIRAVTDFYDSDGDYILRAFDTGQVNWSADGWQDAGELKVENYTVTENFKKVRFWGGCYRVAGSYCSGVINAYYMDYNPDLPKLGDQVVVREP